MSVADAATAPSAGGGTGRSDAGVALLPSATPPVVVAAAAAAMRAAPLTVLRRSMAIVIGPTPPGTWSCSCCTEGGGGGGGGGLGGRKGRRGCLGYSTLDNDSRGPWGYMLGVMGPIQLSTLTNKILSLSYLFRPPTKLSAFKRRTRDHTCLLFGLLYRSTSTRPERHTYTSCVRPRKAFCILTIAQATVSRGIPYASCEAQQDILTVSQVA